MGRVHGDQLDLKIRAVSTFKMKFFVIVSALVAAAYADADAGIYGYSAFPYVYGKSAPCVNAANQPVACVHGYAAYPYGLVHHLGKRSADAEAEPDADALLYAGAYSPLTYGAHTYGAYAYGAYPYAAHYRHAAYPYAAYPYTGYAHGYSLFGK